MNAIATNEKYTRTAQTLHWLVAALVVAQFALAWSADALPKGDTRTLLMFIHKSVGLTVLLLAALRLVWRARHRPPAFPATLPRAERLLSVVTHWGLYVLIVAMPLSGWMMSSSAGSSVQWFGLFTVPDLVGKSERWAEVFHETHEILAWVLFALALFHVAAALWHAVVKKDDILQRMLP